MIDSRQISRDDDHATANGVVRPLARRYFLVLAAVALLMVIDQAVVQPMMVRVNTFAPAINVAGRQRMLSQKLAKSALVLRVATDDTTRDLRRAELSQSLRQWTAEHDALLHGDSTLGIRPMASSELTAAWAQLDPHYHAMVAAARELARLPIPGNVLDTNVDTLVSHEAEFLPTMDRIVKLMEGEAARSVARLRVFAVAIAGAVIALLVGLGWFVVRPATRTIRGQFDELDLRVAQRTAELSAALASLQHEVLEREAAELKNQRLSAQLTHAERVSTMGHLTAGLAHELNQPLAAIANYTEACDVVLNRMPRDGEASRLHEFVRQARQAALRAGQIVRRMRNYVRPNSASISDVHANNLAAEIVELCRSELANAGADVSLDLTTADDRVAVDPIQIQQVLVNLVQNSLQAMQHNGEHPRSILIRTTNDQSTVQFDICDNGPGFANGDHEAAFAPFHSTKREGLGIGLSICRSIVENYQGRVWCEPRPSRGAQVSFTLPLAHPQEQRHRTEPDCLCC